MVFESNDEFGVQNFEKDFNKLFDTYKILVKHKTINQEANDEYLQGDFLGLRTQSFKDKEKFIYITIEEISQNKKQWLLSGKSQSGVYDYECLTPSKNVMNEGDIITFLDGSLKDKEFRVTTIIDTGFKLNTPFTKFRIVKL